jgi:triphosphoribosyl-dephospho-CoA synthase
VNTYRGAIFSQLIVSKAFLTLLADGAEDVRSELPAAIASIAAEVPASASTHGGAAVRDHGVKGALAMARDGYSELFSSWLPFWRSVRGNEYSLNKTLLLIMSTLDDTCIIHSAGMERAAQVKRQASSLLAGFS